MWLGAPSLGHVLLPCFLLRSVRLPSLPEVCGPCGVLAVWCRAPVVPALVFWGSGGRRGGGPTGPTVGLGVAFVVLALLVLVLGVCFQVLYNGLYFSERLCETLV